MDNPSKSSVPAPSTETPVAVSATVITMSAETTEENYAMAANVIEEVNNEINFILGLPVTLITVGMTVKFGFGFGFGFETDRIDPP